MKNTKKGTVAVVGLGYVGLPLALLASERGHVVIGIDYDADKVERIREGVSPFTDEKITEQLRTVSLNATTSYETLGSADTVIVCVPTPVDSDHIPDLTPVIASCTQLAKNIKKGTLVIIESTINPGVCEEVILPILEQESGMVCGRDFYLAHCPERINPGDPNWDVSNIARVVGGYDETSLELAVAFYRELISGKIKAMGSLREAEAVKIVENSFRDVNIAFVNELAMSFSALGIDIVNVIDGAATKPFAFMAHYPGAGVGGHCIPVDPYYLIEYAKTKGFEHRFLSAARDINNHMPHFTIERMNQLLSSAGLSMEKSKIAILGMSYKPDVGDLRESPSLTMAKLLKEKQVMFITLDPYLSNEESDFSHLASEKSAIAKAIQGCDGVIIATAHKEYRELDALFFQKANVKAVIDGRNCLDKNSFKNSEVLYCGIGR